MLPTAVLATIPSCFNGSGGITALIYAQHWAEVDGVVETAVRQQFICIYGTDHIVVIETVLAMIRQGNLWENTADYLLYDLTFGRHGLTEYDP